MKNKKTDWSKVFEETYYILLTAILTLSISGFVAIGSFFTLISVHQPLVGSLFASGIMAGFAFLISLFGSVAIFFKQNQKNGRK